MSKNQALFCFIFLVLKEKNYETLVLCQATVIGNCLYKVLSSYCTVKRSFDKCFSTNTISLIAMRLSVNIPVSKERKFQDPYYKIKSEFSRVAKSKITSLRISLNKHVKVLLLGG